MDWFVYISCAIFMVIGCGGMIFGFQEILLAHQSRNWQTTSGVITESTIVISKDSEGDSMYKPRIRYEYEINGKHKHSHNVYFGGRNISSSSQYFSQKMINRYPRGKQVKVYYHPRSPQQAVLEAGVTKKSFSLFAFGAIFAEMGFFVALIYWLHQ